MLKTTTEGFYKNKKHTHIVFLSQEQSAGYCVGKDHTHEIVYTPPVEPEVDEMGMPISEGQPEQWLMMPNEEDGHTHEMVEYQTDPRIKDDREDTVKAKEVWQLFDQCLELEKNSRKKSKESKKFYKGDQWPGDIKKTLEAQDRACLTINEIQPNIDTLIGYQIDNRQRIDFAPIEGGDEKTADLLDLVINDHILKRSKYAHHETDAFAEAVKVGRGFLDIYMDFDEDIEGKICVKSLTWDEVALGEHKEKDGSDAEVMVKHRMYSKAKLEQMYPEKSKEIHKDFMWYKDRFRLNAEEATMQYAHDNYGKAENETGVPFIGSDNIEMVNLYRKQFRVLECRRKIYRKIQIAAYGADGFIESLEGWKDRDIAQVKKIPGMQLVERRIPRIRITTTCCNVILSDEYPADLPDNVFYTIPIYAYKDENDWWGKIEIVKDVQREINYRYSQSIDFGNRMVSNGWFVSDAMFPEGNKGARNFAKNSSKPGFVQAVNDINYIPKQVQGASFPSEIPELMQLSSIKLKNNMNVTTDSAGANETGDKFMQRHKLMLAGNQLIFDNLSMSKARLGRLLVGLMKRYYDANRIHRIVNDMKQQPDEFGEIAYDYTAEEIQEILDNMDLTKYDVVVTESPDSATTRIGTFMLVKDLMMNGAPIPPQLVIELSEIPKSIKKKSIENLQQQEQETAQMASQSADVEIEKVLVSKGIIPPSVAERLGIQAGPIALQDGSFPNPQNNQPEQLPLNIPEEIQ